MIQVLELMINHAKPGGLHESTLFIIMGDHGQTLTGDHGGGSLEEVETALFAVNLAAAAAYVGNRNLRDIIPPLGVGTTVGFLSSNSSQPAEVATVGQIDFAASLSAMLGLPIPFENVGTSIPTMMSEVCHDFRKDVLGADSGYKRAGPTLCLLLTSR